MANPAILEQYISVSKALLQAGIQAPVDLHLYMPANQNIITFRKKGDLLTPDDLKTINKIQESNFLVLKTDYKAFTDALHSYAAISIVGDPTSAAAQSAAKNVLKGLNIPPPAPGSKLSPQEQAAKTKNMLDNAFNLVKVIIEKCKGSPTGQSFLAVLKDVEKNEDPLQTHCRHVSALSTLGLLALGNASIEDVSDIAFAGLIHDIGMVDIPNILTEKHLNGTPVELLNPSEKIALMRHIDLVFEKLKVTKTFVSDGAKRIIEMHHENWSGSGFKGIKGGAIYRPARVLRIIDELVVNIQNPDYPQDVKQSFLILKGMEDLANGEPLLDLEVLKILEQVIFQ